MPIIPDEKDWTWVLTRPCPECSFRRFDGHPGHGARTASRTCCPAGGPSSAGPTWPNARTTTTWSALEYACHVRDVFSLFDQRLNLMLDDDDARFENWDQDHTAVDKDYANADPAVVSAELTAEGEQIAESFAGVQRGRVGPARACAATVLSSRC